MGDWRLATGDWYRVVDRLSIKQVRSDFELVWVEGRGILCGCCFARDERRFPFFLNKLISDHFQLLT
jgi:hypothetical protein